MLADKEARQFYKVVEEIRRERPPIFLLENVIGLLRVKNDVMNELSTVGPTSYITLCWIRCSTHAPHPERECISLAPGEH